MQDALRERVTWLTADVLRALARQGPGGPGDPGDPGDDDEQQVLAAGVAFLLREYAATGRPDLHDAIGAALARALDEPSRSPEWIETLAEASALSEDARLVAAVNDAAAALRRDWPSRGPTDRAMRSVDACLGAALLIAAEDFTAAAIDELERIVGARYRPGEGIAPAAGATRLADQVSTASALLTAFTLTARLPYAMLAEELLQFSRTLNTEPITPDLTRDRFLTLSALARVYCRMAVLHADADYRRAAVLAPDADYAAAARHTLDQLAPVSRRFGIATALYALAVDDYSKLNT